MATSNLTADTFTRWIVGIAGAAVIAIGGALLGSVTELKQDMAVIKENTKQTTFTAHDHEQRLRQLEYQERRDQDNTRTYQEWRSTGQGGRDTTQGRRN